MLWDTGMAFLVAEGLTVRRGDVVAVRDVSLALAQGEFALLTGPSGCGKTTLALALCGVIPQAVTARVEGQVWVDGRDAAGRTVADLARDVGIVFQNAGTQLFQRTVEEEVTFGPRNLGLSGERAAAQVDAALKGVGIEFLRRREVRHLSGGEQQRVAIAATLAMGARALILDEPTASLDRHGVALVAGSLRRLRERGVTVLLIEHRLGEFVPLADRVLLMDGGRIIANGAPGSVLADRGRLARLGVRFPSPERELVLPEQLGAPDVVDPLVRLCGVEAAYGREPVLRGLDLAIRDGELLAVVGDNGTGKTTLALVLAGLLRPRRGRVQWRRDARALPWGRRVGILSQNPLSQILCETVEAEVAYGADNLRLPRSDVQRLLEAADLSEVGGRAPATLSTGQVQRLALAAAASTRPRLLILDEPTHGQDWAHLERTLDLARRLNRQGHAVMLITHDRKLVCRYAQRIVVLDRGRVVADGPPRRSPGPRRQEPGELHPILEQRVEPFDS